MSDLAVAFHVTVWSVVWEIADGCLSTFSASSGSSEKAIWKVFALASNAGWDDGLLLLHFCMLFIDIDPQI